MADIYGSQNPHSRFCLWVKVVSDPYDRYRGFSLLGREFVVYGGKRVKHKVTCSIDMKDMEGVFWPIHVEEWLRVVPEMVSSRNLSNYMFIPQEFAASYIRPKYNKPSEFGRAGLENEQWASRGVTTFGKYTRVDDAVPGRARQAADSAYNAGLRDDSNAYDQWS